MSEREQIVAWLRKKGDDFHEAMEWSLADKDRYAHWAEAHTLAADAIERSDHIKGD